MEKRTLERSSSRQRAEMVLRLLTELGNSSAFVSAFLTSEQVNMELTFPQDFSNVDVMFLESLESMILANDSINLTIEAEGDEFLSFLKSVLEDWNREYALLVMAAIEQS